MIVEQKVYLKNSDWEGVRETTAIKYGKLSKKMEDRQLNDASSIQNVNIIRKFSKR